MEREPVRIRELGHEPGILCRCRPKVVVEMRDLDRAVAIRCELPKQVEQHDGVEPAGHGHEESGAWRDHSVAIDGGANRFEEHGNDCVDTVG